MLGLDLFWVIFQAFTVQYSAGKCYLDHMWPKYPNTPYRWHI